MPGLIALLALWVAAGTLVFVGRYWQWLRSAWCEPVLRQLVVVFESDDWGPGCAEDARALQRLADILESRRDKTGRPAMMTIGLVLAVPDTRLQEVRRGERYVPRMLDDDAFGMIRAALRDGERRQVFALQLHGMEHYWPPALMKAAAGEQGLVQWLSNDEVPRTERLPAALQTRWADCAVLPSSPIQGGAVRAAVDAEVKAFNRIFGQAPQVVVPPTFVWTDMAEQAWAANAVEVIVTPGRQFTGRDAHGAPTGRREKFWNGQISPSGMSRLVRDAYFEPAYGHRREDAISIVEERLRSGRPVLFETHRFNFLAQLSENVDGAFYELTSLLDELLERFPQVVFRSPRELARALEREDEQWVERHLLRRLWPVMVRLNGVPGLRKWALLSGAVIPGLCLILIGRLTRRKAWSDRVSGNAET